MAEATHLLGLPLKHRMKDVKGLTAELQSFLKLDGSRPMTGKFQGLDGVFRPSTNTYWDIVEDHARFPYPNTEFAVIRPKSRYYGSDYPGIGIISHSLYVMDIDGVNGGFVYVVSPDDVNKLVGIYWSSAPDEGRIYTAVGNLVFGGLDNTFVFQPIAKIYGGVSAANCRFEISRAGDITLLSGKILNAINGVLRLPNSAPTSPSAGDTYFDASTNTLYVYNGTAWVSVTLT